MMFPRSVLLLSLILACPAVAAGEPVPTAGGGPVFTGSTAQHVYRSATQGRDPGAMYMLGNMFEQGIGVAKDYEAAFRWYYRAAELGNGEAMNSLGIAYAMGQGAPRNDELSLRWFLKAAEKGSIPALSNIAKSYYLGAGVPVGYPEAATWFERAARKGDPGAMNNLAVMYEHGLGVAKDPDAAVALFAKSARRGYPLAMRNLGVLYANGDYVRQDNLVAFAWMEAALEAGLQGEERDEVAHELGALATRLSAGELTRARILGGEIVAAAVRQQQPRKGQAEPAAQRPVL